MCLRYHAAYAVGDVAHLHAGLSGHAEQVDVVSAVVHLLHECDGQHHGLFVAAVDVHVAVAVVDTHHIIIYGVDAYELTAWVASAGEERLVHLLADDADLASLTDVHLVDVSSVEHLRRSDLLHVGHHALHGA